VCHAANDNADKNAKTLKMKLNLLTFRENQRLNVAVFIENNQIH